MPPRGVAFDWIKRAFASDLPTTTKIVLLALVRFAKPGADGGRDTAWRPLDLLVKDTGLSRRSVQKGLANLRKTGWIERVGRTPFKVPIYALRVGAQQMHRAGGAPTRAQQVRLKGAAGAPKEENQNCEEQAPQPPRRGVRRPVFVMLMEMTQGDEIPDWWADPPRQQVVAMQELLGQRRRGLDCWTNGIQVSVHELEHALPAVWQVRVAGVPETEIRFR